MNNELQSWSDDIIYKHALTFSHEELAGMYALCNKREQEYLKEIKALRLILQSHGEVIEMNAELHKHIDLWQDQANFYEQMKDELWEDNIKLEKENARLCEESEEQRKALFEDCLIFDKLKEENARLREALKELVESIYTPYLLGLAVKPNEDWVALNFAKQLLERGE